MSIKTTKAAFLDIVRGMKNPSIKRHKISVSIQDGDDTTTYREIYCASTFRECGYLSAMNQYNKFACWLKVELAGRQAESEAPADKEYCYRYVDGNEPGTGAATVQLWKRVVIRKTDKTFWHVWDYEKLTMEQIRQMYERDRRNGRKTGVKRCLIGGSRSSFHLTKEEALRAFVYRKVFQLDRMLLTAETVRLCLALLADSGYIKRDEYGKIGVWAEVLKAPDVHLCADEPGQVAQSYNWNEY